MAKTNPADVKKARVTVEIDGEEVVLVPSPDAIITLSGKYDGFGPLVAALGRLNLGAAIDTVNAGLGLDGRAAREMGQAVAMTSLIEICPKLSEFAAICANGGKPLKPEREEKAAANPS